MSGIGVEVDLQKTDALGHPVPGNNIGGNYTDNTGTTTIELPPGRFIVIANVTGYPWGTLPTADGLSNVPVQPGQLTRIVVQMGSITFTATTVDSVISGHGVAFDLQKTSAPGKPVEGANVAGGYTDNTGTYTSVLSPGPYVVMSSFQGYNWGDLSDGQGTTNVQVRPGKDTVVNVRLGRIRVATVAGTLVQVYMQTTASNGSPTAGAGVASGYADNTGYWLTDVTAGTYVVTFGEKTQFGIVVVSGQVANLR
jgi:predicted GNAT family acetyltransferase